MTDCIAKPIGLAGISELWGNVYDDEPENGIIALDLQLDESYQERFPVRLDFLLLGLCTGGEAVFGIDMDEYTVREGCLMALRPGNFVLKCRVETLCSFKAVACHLSVVQKLLPGISEILPLVMHNPMSAVMPLDSSERERMCHYLDFIASTLQGSFTPFREQKLECELQAALFELLDIHAERFGGETAFFRTRREEMMARFISLVTENFRTERTVSWYASKLDVSPKHLTFVVKSVSGKTPGKWIDSYVALEAKMLLRKTTLSIAAIAEQLNFGTQSLFGKYFKKATGLSPSDFRRES